MASSLLKDRCRSPKTCTKEQIHVSGPQHIEELLASDNCYLIMRAIFRPNAVAFQLPEDCMEDVLQEVVLAILECLKRQHKKRIRRWRGWLRQVMRNKIVDAFRHRHSRDISLDALGMEPTSPEADRVEIDLEQRRAWVMERLMDMATDQSINGRLLRGRFVDGLTNGALAEAERLSEKAVERRICRMLQKLRQRAAQDGLLPRSQ